jgi:hypothetical protein
MINKINALIELEKIKNINNGDEMSKKNNFLYCVSSFLLFSFSHSVFSKVINILALDGGGTKGIMEATYLSELEQDGIDIRKQFNVIVGTSTGGLIALGLSVKNPKNTSEPLYKASDFVDMYLKRSQDIFGSGRSFLGSLFYVKHDYKKLEKVLKDYYQDQDMNDALGYVGVVTTFKHHTKSLLLNSYEAQTDSESFHNISFLDAARGSTAAPGYFETHIISKTVEDDWQYLEEFEDGGVLENNPAYQGLKLAKKIYGDYDENESKNIFQVVSIGAGFEKPEKKSSISGLLTALLHCFDKQGHHIISQINERVMEEIGEDCFVRVQFELPFHIELDSSKTTDLKALQLIAYKKSFGSEYKQIKMMLDRE